MVEQFKMSKQEQKGKKKKEKERGDTAQKSNMRKEDRDNEVLERSICPSGWQFTEVFICCKISLNCTLKICALY